MSSIIIKNKLFFTLVVVFMFFLVLQTLAYPKGSLVLWFASLRTPAGNFLFKYITHLGDGWAFIIVSILLLLFVKLRWGIISILTYAVSGLLAQFFKKIVFGPLSRPLKYFEGNESLTPIEGVHNAMVHTFPSGHTTTAFAMFTLLVLFFSGNRAVALVCFVIVVLAAISRIYLAQHFAEDVLAGTILGTLCSVILYFWWEVKQPAFFKSAKLDQPLLSLKK